MKGLLACSAVQFDILAQTFIITASFPVLFLSHLQAKLRFSSSGPPGQ